MIRVHYLIVLFLLALSFAFAYFSAFLQDELWAETFFRFGLSMFVYMTLEVIFGD